MDATGQNAANAANSASMAAPLDSWWPPRRRGLFIVPVSGRAVWWTGRVAIGLRHALDAADSAFLASELPVDVASEDRPEMRRGG